MDLLISIVSSSAIAGIFVFILKESYKAKLSLVKVKLDRLEKYQDKDFDHSFKLLNDIWVALTRMDDYLRYDFPIHLSEGDIDSRYLRPFTLKVKESMALLPSDLYETTQGCLNEISAEWESCAKEVIRLTNLNATGNHDAEKLLEKANESRESMSDNIEAQLMKLRENFREHVSAYQKT